MSSDEITLADATVPTTPTPTTPTEKLEARRAAAALKARQNRAKLQAEKEAANLASTAKKPNAKPKAKPKAVSAAKALTADAKAFDSETPIAAGELIAPPPAIPDQAIDNTPSNNPDTAVSVADLIAGGNLPTEEEVRPDVVNPSPTRRLTKQNDPTVDTPVYPLHHKGLVLCYKHRPSGLFYQYNDSFSANPDMIPMYMDSAALNKIARG